jgi:hypothetical protein
MRLLISEVHNFGGFFGGDTVTLSGAAWPDGGEELTLTVDEAALANVADRHTVAAGMLLDLAFVGERVERAVLLGARDHGALRRALGAPPLPAALTTPLVLARRCPACQLWFPVSSDDGSCPICGAPPPAFDTATP